MAVAKNEKCRETGGCCLCSVGVACLLHRQETAEELREAWGVDLVPCLVEDAVASGCCGCCQGVDESTWRELTEAEVEAAGQRISGEWEKIEAIMPPGALERLV